MPELTTAVLRICYTLGTPGTGTLASFLRGQRVPMVLGLRSALPVHARGRRRHRHPARAGEAAARRLQRGRPAAGAALGHHPRDRPHARAAARAAAARGCSAASGFPRLPPGALAHIKYPIVVDARRFREATGFQYEHDEGRILRIFREASPPPGS